MFDLVVRGDHGDIGIEDGVIAAVGMEVGTGRQEIDARGLAILPGLIDIHLHFNEPGRTEWEGAHTGSRALAAGGGTLFFDMPLNSTPCTVNPVEFDRKVSALSAASRIERSAGVAERATARRACLCSSFIVLTIRPAATAQCKRLISGTESAHFRLIARE